MNAEFLMGVGVAIVAALLIYAVMLVRSKKGASFCAKADFDERQVVARGVAFQAGFFTLLGCNAGAICLEAGGVTWLEHGMGYIGSLLVGVVVFALVSIHKDAYMGLNQNPRRWIVGFGLMMLINLVCAVVNLFIRKEINGRLGFINLAVAAMMLVVIVAQGVHLLRFRREQEDE